jgi:hypothetical protein
VNFPKQYASQQPLTSVIRYSTVSNCGEGKRRKNKRRKKDTPQQEEAQSTMKYTSALMGPHIKYQNHKTEAQQLPSTILGTR